MSSDLPLAGKLALVTGGTRGIGKACVQALADAGARVAFSGRGFQNQARIDPSQSKHIKFFRADLSRQDAPEHLCEAVIASLGVPDILVNNAGVLKGPAERGPGPAWDYVHAVNLRAPYLLVAALAPKMTAGSVIINVASIAGQTGGMAADPAYAASKAGLIGLTKSQARALGARSIRVNCVAPADIETDMIAEWDQGLRARLLAATPLQRFGEPAEVAAAVLFLASPSASFITGQTLSINGGAYLA